MGWRALAPCVTSPHPETDFPEAKQRRLCLLSKSGLRNKKKSQIKMKFHAGFVLVQNGFGETKAKIQMRPLR